MNASEKWARRERLLEKELQRISAYKINELFAETNYDDVEERIEYVPINTPKKVLNQVSKQSLAPEFSAELNSISDKISQSKLIIQDMQVHFKSIEETSQQILSAIQTIYMASSAQPAQAIDTYSLAQNIIIPIQKEVKRLETEIMSLKRTSSFYSSPDDLFFEKDIFKKETRTFDKELADFALTDIDKMGGNTFSDYIASLFKRKGYEARALKRSYDSGIDVIASNDIVRIGIQCKICNSDHLKLSAVQEVIAGLSYYSLDKGILISNSYFSKSIKELARANNIILWDREVLARQIRKLRAQQ